MHSLSLPPQKKQETTRRGRGREPISRLVISISLFTLLEDCYARGFLFNEKQYIENAILRLIEKSGNPERSDIINKPLHLTQVERGLSSTRELFKRDLLQSA